MSKGRFLNQKLGKRTSRRHELVKQQLHGGHRLNSKGRPDRAQPHVRSQRSSSASPTSNLIPSKAV